MVPLLVIMQRSKVFAYSQCHRKKKKKKKKRKGKQEAIFELTSVRNEKSNGREKKKKTAGKWIGSANFFGNLPKGLPPGKGPVDFQAGAFSYALISNYVPVVCLMLPDTINGCLMVSPGQMRHSTLQTLNIYISLQRRRRTPRRPRQTEKEREKKKKEKKKAFTA